MYQSLYLIKPCMNLVNCSRPKPEPKKPKPVEKIEEPRKLSEPKPFIRKLPQRKMSDAISLQMQIT